MSKLFVDVVNAVARLVVIYFEEDDDSHGNQEFSARYSAVAVHNMPYAYKSSPQ